MCINRYMITISVCVKRRKTNTKNRRDRTGNNSCNPERVSMSNEPPVDHDRRNHRKANKTICVFMVSLPTLFVCLLSKMPTLTFLWSFCLQHR